ncbi:hypothetical protein M8312_03990 [Sphingomonas sp. KRR8]|nr:hypothetical protein [Sphingomonas sp. KRR8]URD61681.1 hypothetical protein M8312_03990 [Sphingomonas sp. KRR8]
MISRTPEVRTGTERLSLAEEQRRADDADRARRARQPRNGFPLSYLFRN